jgi:sugar/nucleoside kinase (ribokinase family)
VFDIVAVGHLCIDLICLPNKSKPFTSLGGSSAYVSIVARRLGAKASIISKVGGDFPEAYVKQLTHEGINLSEVVTVKDSRTTSFELRYSNDLSSRTLRLRNKAPPIMVEDLPKSLHTKIIHVSPIAREVSYEVIEALRKQADLLSLDPQGLVRNFDEEGKVNQVPMADKRVLELIDVYKSSIDEVKAITNTSTPELAIKRIHNYGVKVVIVTLGTAGAILSHESGVQKIPPYKSSKVIDPTGAGDVFIGAFLAEHVKEKEVLWCACVGSAAASLAVESVGTKFSINKDEIYQRARIVYEKGIKQ